MKDFLFTLLAWLLTLPFIVAAIGFAVYNDSAVPVTLNPFQVPMPMPVYVPVLAGVGIGFLFGSLMTWAGMGGLRKDRNEHKKKARLLEKQLEVANHAASKPHGTALISSASSDRI